ncbi:MAG TPA: aldolase/citrate lyase family protein [Terriglobales bacterium]|nr:aldolase/citrate lyase family protein [Terriglobales bacterium]
MRPNKLRTLLKNDRPTIGTHLFASWGSAVEVVGHSGCFDYVEFVAQYAPFDLNALEDFCRAAELHQLGTMIKVDQEPRRFLAQRAIGAGFESVLFADCRTPQDAEECVRAVRAEDPQGRGTHGVAARRIALMHHGGSAAYAQTLDDSVVVLMIEKKTAVERLEEVLSVPGIDMVQWGPADYALSIGKPGCGLSPEVKRVEKEVIAAAHRRGILARAEVNSVDDARYYMDLGVQHFCLGSDVFILFDWLRRNGEQLRKALGE